MKGLFWLIFAIILTIVMTQLILRSKLKTILRTLFFTLIGIALLLLIYDQRRDYYHLDQTTFTVWNRLDGMCYIMPYRYKGVFSPKENYISVSNHSAVMILMEDDSTYIVYNVPSRGGKIECRFKDNKCRYIPPPEDFNDQDVYWKVWDEYENRLPYIWIDVLESDVSTYRDRTRQNVSSQQETNLEKQPERWDTVN